MGNIAFVQYPLAIKTELERFHRICVQKGAITISFSDFLSAVKDVAVASFASRHPWRDGRWNAEPGPWRAGGEAGKGSLPPCVQTSPGHQSEHFPFAHSCHDLLTSALSCYSAPLPT